MRPEHQSDHLKVTVVVPVHNIGDRLHTCVSSVLEQTMPASEYEAVFVDDGSTDGSGERLDELAARYPRLRVLHLGGTGGPGGPRNVGIDAARGEYIYFLDHDDWLGSAALERMYALAERNDSDIVIGKLVGHGRHVPVPLFRRTKDNADIVEDHLLSLLTPHKLFRRQLLLDSGIRFPEGRTWLEDHRFVVPAFFQAKVISVLADYACCHWMKLERGANLSARGFGASDYFQVVREVLDVVDANTEPGERRDRMYTTWYVAKLLRRLGRGRLVFGWPLRYRQLATYRAARKLALERFPTSVERWLPPTTRVAARLLRTGGWAGWLDLARLQRAERDFTFQPTLRHVGWDDGRLVVRVTGQLVYGDGTPLRVEQQGDRLLWRPPVRFRTPVPDEAYDLTEDLANGRVHVYVRHRADQAEYAVPTDSELGVDNGTLTFTGTARLDLDTGKAGGALEPGTWDCIARVEACGWNISRRLGSGDLDRNHPPAPDSTRLRPYWTGMGNLSVRVRPAK